MRSAALYLERFDPAPAAKSLPAEMDAREQRLRAEAYTEGFAAGQAAATANATRPLIAQTAEALANEYADAPERIAHDAAGALIIVLERLFPALAQAGFAVEAGAAFTRLADTTASPSLEIFCSPQQLEALRAELARLAPERQFTVTADPEISGATARARWSTGGVDFDLDQATEECLAALRRAVQSLESEKES